MIGAAAVIAGTPSQAWRTLDYRPSPADNPLRGLVPYAGAGGGRFPHSLEFDYLPVAAVVTEGGRYDWTALERLLEDVRSRGNQTIFRFFLEYPGRPDGIPAAWKEAGLRVHRLPADPAAPTGGPETGGPEVVVPDYGDPRWERPLVRFIEALGRRYDGDPRIGYVTAGLLGAWGEWHTHPRSAHHPPKRLQTAVMDAYARSFRRTRVLLRYPAGPDDPAYAPNHDRPGFGYHDDSFAWATLDTPREDDGWHFANLLRRAGVGDRWRTAPIGGEIRPEAWGQVFDAAPPAPIQDFDRCVDATRVTWLMDSGMFGATPDPVRRARALRSVGRMGYELHVRRTRIDRGSVEVELENRGSAPFYAGWPAEVGILRDGRLVRAARLPGDLASLMPGQVRSARVAIAVDGVALLRVPNPMAGGKPLRFANAGQDVDRIGWLTLGPATSEAPAASSPTPEKR